MARKVSAKKSKTEAIKTEATKTSITRTEAPPAETGTNHNVQTFSFTAPAATSVQLVGDFTQWHEKPVNLQKGADGVWRTTIELAPGVHHYRFLVDGQWRDDPECTLRAPNPFGGENMIRKVA